MRTCKTCKEPVEKGYFRDPVSGQASKDFHCDDCFERGMQRAAQSIVHNGEQAMNSMDRLSNRKRIRKHSDY